jgi:hypothetical protein
MSDYLWDKTGEAEEEVKRLEELLSEFRHRPRALELPAAVGARGAERRRASRVFRPAVFAVAATLLLVVLAGALFVLRRGAAGDDGRREQQQAASQGPQSTTRQDSPRRSMTPQAAMPQNVETARHANESVRRDEPDEPGGRDGRTAKDERTLKDERMARQVVHGKSERLQDGGGEVIPRRGGGLKSASSRPDERDNVAPGTTTRIIAEAAPLEEPHVPLEERRRLAKDDLMYVLRLTGLKLKEVQRKTQRVDGLKSAFDEQRRNR